MQIEDTGNPVGSESALQTLCHLRQRNPWASRLRMWLLGSVPPQGAPQGGGRCVVWLETPSRWFRSGKEFVAHEREAVSNLDS